MNRLYLFPFLLIFFLKPALAQRYPVQGSATLIPPYNLRLSEYQTSTSERFVLNLLLADVTKPELPVRFHFSITGQNVKLETKPEFIGTAVTLQGGIPLRLSNLELAEYFNPNHLNFSGISKADFLKTGVLPEGFYNFTIEVYEYHRGVKISGAISAPAWLILNDPPLINLPNNGTKLTAFSPQNIVMQWTPRHTGSPNAAFTTEYDIKVVEVWPASRDPNDAILSQPPIFQTTTTTTSLIYGPDATPLEPGRTYAFRVQAKAISGSESLDLFKNNGFSQTSTFIFGDACDPPVHITAQSESPSRFSLQWDAAPSQTGYSIKYRPSGKDSEWYTNTSVITSTDISGLQPATSYDYQITSICGSFESSASPVASFTTVGLEEKGYSCGVAPPSFSLDASHRIDVLKVGDVVQAGDFDVTITKISGSHGIFSGEGAVVMPFFNSVRGRVTFSGITVNADKRMVAGMMNLVGGAVEVPSVITNSLDVLSQTLSIIDSTLLLAQQFLPATPPDPNSFVADTLITVPGGIKSVRKDLSGNIILTDNAGVTQTLSPGKNIAIADPSGNGVIVSVGGGITNTTAAKVKAAARREYNLVMSFANTSSSQFGFDGQTLDALSKNYEQLNNLYYVSWKAVAAGQSDLVKASGGERLDISRIQFLQGDSSPMSYSDTPTVNGPGVGQTESLVALYAPADTTKKEQLLGKLNVVGYDPKSFTVHLVPINGVKINASSSAIQAQFNKIYSQAVVSWEVHLEDSIHVSGLGSPFDNGGSGLLSNYTSDMKSVINAYDKAHPLQDGHYYLFILPAGANESESGYMPRSKQCGFIFSDGKTDPSSLIRTMAHELGHGAFTLKHTFETYPALSKGSTSNLMDYAGGTSLWKFQWDLIHNPVIVISLFQSDSSGASVKVYDSIPRLLQNSDHKTVSFLTPSGTIIALPKSVANVVFFHGIESKKFINLVTGTLVGFTVNDTKYNAVIDETGNFSGYSDGKNYYTKDSITKNIVIEKFIMGLPTTNNFSLYAFSVNSTWSKYSFGKERIKTESTLGLTLFTVNQVLAKKDLDKNTDVYNEGYTAISDAEVSSLAKYADTPELLYVLKIKQIQNVYPQACWKFTSQNEDWDFPFSVKTYIGIKEDPRETTTFEYPIGKWGAIIQAAQERWTTLFNTNKVAYFSAMLDTLKEFIDQYTTKTFKNVVLFVNGYRFSFPENAQTDNTITRTDRFNYWAGIDQQFANRLNSATWLYADGHHSISTSNHSDMLHFYCSAKSSIPAIPSSGTELALKYGENVLTITLRVEVKIAIRTACLEYLDGAKLNTKANPDGFMIRYNNGKIAGQNLLNDIQSGRIKVNVSNGVITDSLDIVAHSMGFAYAQGMIEVLKGKIPLAGYYIIAPENAGSGRLNPTDFTQLWQYGSDETLKISIQDGVAPQTKVGDLPDDQRTYIPDNWSPQGFISSHSIENYQWIFTKEKGDPGYVQPRK